MAYPRAVLDVVGLAVDPDDGGRRDGGRDVDASMMCRWKLWPVDPDGGANARTEGTTVRRHSSAPVEVEEVGLLDFMALLQKLQKMTEIEIPTVRNGKWNPANRASQLCVILDDSG